MHEFRSCASTHQHIAIIHQCLYNGYRRTRKILSLYRTIKYLFCIQKCMVLQYLMLGLTSGDFRPMRAPVRSGQSRPIILCLDNSRSQAHDWSGSVYYTVRWTRALSLCYFYNRCLFQRRRYCTDFQINHVSIFVS